MKKGKSKRSGIEKIYTKEYYDYKVNIKKGPEKDALQLINDPTMSENKFLQLYRDIPTYEERKKQLEKRNYYKVPANWATFINGGEECEDYYYTTFTINLKGESENWVKRKSFENIKEMLLKRGMVFEDIPYEKCIVLGDDLKTEHIFYRKK